MNFQETIKENLCAYKHEKLKIKEPGIYNYQGDMLEYDHILPTELKHLNVIHHYRNDFYNSDLSKISYHKYFHHLNSSQALCVNLFFPLIVSGETRIISELLELPTKSIKSPCFEFVSDIEVAKKYSRKTNFDFFCKLSDKLKVYMEVKYSENEFGKAKMDKAHIDKFYDTYEPLLMQNPFINRKYKQMENFLFKYQIMRNLVHINDDSIVVFIYPKGNKKIDHQANMAFSEILTESGKSKLKLLPIENAIKFILENAISSKLIEHYKEFENKYLGHET